jgi:hypothetical protein
MDGEDFAGAWKAPPPRDGVATAQPPKYMNSSWTIFPFFTV